MLSIALPFSRHWTLSGFIHKFGGLEVVAVEVVVVEVVVVEVVVVEVVVVEVLVVVLPSFSPTSSGRRTFRHFR